MHAQNNDQQFAAMPHITDYDAMQDALVNMRQHDVGEYPQDMHMDMLNMQSDFASNLEQQRQHHQHPALNHDRDTRGMYKYSPYNKDQHDLNEYSSALTSELYRQGDERHMLFVDTDLVHSEVPWQEKM